MLLDDYEEFNEEQKKILERYVTNTSGHIFVLRNLPEVIKGVLFSKYSRSNLGLRSLLLKEFIGNDEEAAFSSIVGIKDGDPSSSFASMQAAAIQKAQNFYDRILDGYGDDSIGELGGAHAALENISVLAAKFIEDSRIGGSPLEKSTRYVYFDQKIKGEYSFYREPVIMTSAYREIYISTCNMLFDTYTKLIPPLTTMIEEKFERDPALSKAAYTASLRAKVLDCLRGLLPASTMTNMGVYGNGRFYESLIHKLHVHPLAEIQDIGKRLYSELSKVIPSFIRRSALTHHTHQGFAQFWESMHGEIQLVSERNERCVGRTTEPGVKLISYDQDAVVKVAAALLYSHGNRGLQDLIDHCRGLSEEEVGRILDAACGARENRRHKSPRALEHANFTFEIIADYGSYRDLHRHRILTQERQLLTCDYGYYIPPEIVDTELEKDYMLAMDKAKIVYDHIASELPEEAQYVVPMAYNVRWYFHVNLRALQWMCELRSSPAGHVNYRVVAQMMARLISEAIPSFERFFKFVNYDQTELGRLAQEQRNAEKSSE